MVNNIKKKNIKKKAIINLYETKQKINKKKNNIKKIYFPKFKF